MVKEVTQRAFPKLRHHGPSSREESHESLPEMSERLERKEGPDNEADTCTMDNSYAGIRSSTDTVQVANRVPPQNVEIVDHADSGRAATMDLIGLGVTSFASVPLLAMMVATDERGVSISSSVSMPVLVYGILIGLFTGVFLGRASKDTRFASTSASSGLPSGDGNGSEPELQVAWDNPIPKELAESTDGSATPQGGSSSKRGRFRNEHAATSFETMKQKASQRAVKIKENVKEMIHRRTGVSPSRSPSRVPRGALLHRPLEPSLGSSATSKALMDQLLGMGSRFKRTRVDRRTVVTNSTSSQEAPSMTSTDAEKPTDDNDLQQPALRTFGKFQVKVEDVVTLEDVIAPAMKLRGLDIFVADRESNEGQTNMGEHPHLIEQGLRDTGTLLLNLITGHCNIVLYLQLPSYVTQLHDLKEQDDDDEEVKAIKRFINGDDEYRKYRLKVLPSVTEAPFAIRVIAPAKKELIVHCTYVPCTWRKHEASKDPRTGKTLAPLLEVEVDCMSDKWVRSIVNLCVKHAHTRDSNYWKSVLRALSDYINKSE
jgi:hypothetical protein